MKTNFQALRSIIDHRKEVNDKVVYGIVNDEEAEFITNEMSLKEKDLTALQDARDFTVVYLNTEIHNNKEDERMLMDLLSMIVFVIDCEKIKKGGEV